MPDYLGRDQRKTKPSGEEDEKIQGATKRMFHNGSFNSTGIAFLSSGRRGHKDIENIREFPWKKLFIVVTYAHILIRFCYFVRLFLCMYVQGAGPYAATIKQADDEIQACIKRVNELAGIKESDTGLAGPSLWDLAADKQALQSEEPLQVGRE